MIIIIVIVIIKQRTGAALAVFVAQFATRAQQSNTKGPFSFVATGHGHSFTLNHLNTTTMLHRYYVRKPSDGNDEINEHATATLI